MGFSVFKNTVSAEKDVKLYKNNVKLLYIYGNEVWDKTVWETLFAGSESIIGEGSFAVSGLRASDRAYLTVTVHFLNFYGLNSRPVENLITATLQRLPLRVEQSPGAYVDFDYADGSISFKFCGKVEQLKGIATRQSPYKVVIQEVRRKV